MKLKSYSQIEEKIWFYVYHVLCIAIFIFLIFPILVIIPLSFNADPYFTFTKEMLLLDPDGFSLRWYKDFFNDDAWLGSIKNSFIIGFFSTILSTVLGTLAALGLSRSYMPGKAFITSLLISPMIIPLIISGASMYFFFSKLYLAQTFLGAIFSHTVLGTPFVVITVTATLVSFNESFIKASASLGASPIYTFFKITVPLIAPGIISGALFAFVVSFDEIVVILFIGGYEQRTIPIQMWSGIREQISPTILAVATLLICFTIFLLVVLEFLRRRTEKLRSGV